MIRVVIADDQALVRGGFRALLNSQPDIDVVGEAADGTAAVAAVRHATPDVVLMDVRMPNLDGIAATAQITSDPRLAKCRVIVLTTFDLDEYVFGAIRAGASGFALKDLEPTELTDAVRVVAGGEALLAPSHTRRLIEAYVRDARPQLIEPDNTALAGLTPREVEVLTLIGQGRSNTDIAAELVLSPLTVKTHIARLFTKVDARDRAQLVVLAYESGLVVPGAGA